MITEKQACVWRCKCGDVGQACTRAGRRRVSPGGAGPIPPDPNPSARVAHHEDADILVLGEEEAVRTLADGGLQVSRFLLDLQ